MCVLLIFQDASRFLNTSHTQIYSSQQACSISLCIKSANNWHPNPRNYTHTHTRRGLQTLQHGSTGKAASVWEPPCQKSFHQWSIIRIVSGGRGQSLHEGLIMSSTPTNTSWPDSIQHQSIHLSVALTPLEFTSPLLSIIQRQSNYELESEPSIAGVMRGSWAENDEGGVVTLLVITHRSVITSTLLWAGISVRDM